MSSRDSSIYASVEWEDMFCMGGVPKDGRIKKIQLTRVSVFVDNAEEHQRAVLSYNDGEIKGIVRALRSAEQELPLTKRRKVEAACRTPSHFGKPSHWGADDLVACAMPNHRYLMDSLVKRRHCLPITLQVKEFGEFEDLLNSDSGDHYVFSSMTLELMQSMSRIYRHESERVEEFKTIVNKKFNIGHLSKVPNFATDLTLKHANGVIVGNYEFKNELGMGGGSPNLQQCGYAIKLTANEQTRSPLLLTTVAGPHYFQVFGSAWNGDVLCIDPLMDPVSLLHVPHKQEAAAEKVAHVLSATYVTAEKLGCLSKEPTCMYTSAPYFECPGLKYGKSVARKWNVWNATLTDANVIVKFVKQYGLEVQQSLASTGMAPPIRHTEELPGGWRTIVMDKKEGGSLYSKPLNENEKGRFSDFRRALLDILKKSYFVHGDLRDQNIIHHKESFFVIDFDWAGKENCATYPIDINMKLGCWARGVAPGAPLVHEHDKYQLDWLCGRDVVYKIISMFKRKVHNILQQVFPYLQNCMWAVSKFTM